MADSPRIQELRRRIQQDPASLSFAPLAEELRRAGRLQEAVDTCRAGLAIHPAYVTARATLGRALLDQGALEEALAELTAVLSVAPDHLAALKGVTEIREHLAALAPPAEAPPLPPPTERPDAVVLRRLERFLAAVLADRARRR